MGSRKDALHRGAEEASCLVLLYRGEDDVEGINLRKDAPRSIRGYERRVRKGVVVADIRY